MSDPSDWVQAFDNERGTATFERASKPTTPAELDNRMNASVATGAIWMALGMHHKVNECDVISPNELLVRFDFLASPYRITVTKETGQ